jgi:hypothetical protein
VKPAIGFSRRFALAATSSATDCTNAPKSPSCVADDVAAKAKRRENPMAGFTPDRSRALDAILDELRAVHALLVEKASPEDVDDFGKWIRMASQRAALAAKEGGFLGIGAERVSEREQQMLDTLGGIFGGPPGSQ